MVTLEQFLIVALVLLMTASVACGVVAVGLLRRALKSDRTNRSSEDARGAELTAPVERFTLEHEELRRQVGRARSGPAGVWPEAEQTIDETHRQAEVATAIAEFGRMAAKAQLDAMTKSHKRVFEAFGEFREEGVWQDRLFLSRESGPLLTQNDIEHLLDMTKRSRQIA